jgi:hypothetical protein
MVYVNAFKVRLPKPPLTSSPVSAPPATTPVPTEEAVKDGVLTVDVDQAFDPLSSSTTPVAAPPATPLPSPAPAPITMANPTNTGAVASASGTMPNAAAMAMNYGVSITWPPVSTTYPSGMA